MTPNAPHPHLTKPKSASLFVYCSVSPCEKPSHRDVCRTGTHRLVMAVSPSNIPSGRVVRALWSRYLWVSKEGDAPRSNDKLVTSHVFLPCAAICRGMASPARYTDHIRMRQESHEGFAARDDPGTIRIASRQSRWPTIPRCVQVRVL